MIREYIIDLIKNGQINLGWLSKEMNKSRFLIGKEEMYSPYGIEHALTNDLLTPGEVLILICLLRLDMEQMNVREFIQNEVKAYSI